MNSKDVLNLKISNDFQVKEVDVVGCFWMEFRNEQKGKRGCTTPTNADTYIYAYIYTYIYIDKYVYVYIFSNNFT